MIGFVKYKNLGDGGQQSAKPKEFAIISYEHKFFRG